MMTLRALLLDQAYTEVPNTIPRKTREAFPMANMKNENIRVFRSRIVPQMILRFRPEKGVDAFSIQT